MSAARPSGSEERSASICATRLVSVSPAISKVRTTGSASSRPSASAMARRTSEASQPVFAEISRLTASGSNSWQTSMPPPRRRSHHHGALTPVKLSCTRAVALSARSWLRYSVIGTLYQPRAYLRRSATIQFDEGRNYPMLLVKDSMTREIVTLAPDETVGTALALCRERRIRHLPVLTEGRLVGIVSDRDLRSATPAFGDQARAAALQEILVEDVMVSDMVSALPDDPIEQAANTMREHKIGCLPVVESGELVGIITSSDVMSALVYLVGANEPGSRMEIAVPDRPGSLAGAAGVFGMCGINIVSAAMGPIREPHEEGVVRDRVVVFRVDTIDTTEVVGYLEEAGYSVLWPPKP